MSSPVSDQVSEKDLTSALSNEWLITRLLCKKSFVDFVREFWDEVPGTQPIIWNWHIDLICDELQKMAERIFANKPKEYDIAINISPGTSKSTLSSILFPAWMWTRMPHARILTASHADDLTLDLANKSRTVIISEKYQKFFPEIKLSSSQAAKSYYTNTLGGDRKTATVGGKSPVGFHGHAILIDDPLDPKKALSEAEIQNAKEFMTNVIVTRKVDKAVTATFLIMQRLGIEDSTAVMLEGAKRDGADKVRHICLPALLEKNEDGTYSDEDVKPKELAKNYTDGVMDPHRLGRSVLKPLEANGALFFATQFLQKPYSPMGGMFNEAMFNQRKKIAPYNCRRVRYFDRACLTCNASIITINGPKRIDKIKENDFVLTRKGYKKVKWAGITKYVDNITTVKFSNGSILEGTPEHLVWTKNRKWVELSLLTNNDIILSLKGNTQWQTKEIQNEKRYFFKILDIQEKLAKSILPPIDGIKQIKSTFTIPCTGQFGDFIKEKFHKDIIFTTKTKISIIMISQILSVLLQKSMEVIMAQNHLIKDHLLIQSMCKKYNELMQRKGQMERMENQKIQESHVFIVGCYSSHTVVEKPIVKIKNAVSKEKKNTGGLIKNVKYVETSIGGWQKQDHVPIIVEENSLKKLKEKIPVYDIEVEDCHEFFANGILVHNSTARNQKDTGCNTAGVLLAMDSDGSFYIEHVVVGKWEPGERNDMMRATAMRDRMKYGPKYEPTIWVEAEGGSSGRDAWLGIVRHLHGFVVKEHRVSGMGSKETRAEPWSAQLSAKNVFVIDNGESQGTGKAEWDIESYVKELCAFPHGRYKDRTDASSGAFSVLVRSATPGTIRIYNLSGRKDKIPVRLVICDKEKLESLVIEQSSLLVSIRDALPLGDDSMVKHSIIGIQDQVILHFTDINSEEIQDKWTEPYNSLGQLPQDLIMTREEGKKLWGMLLKKRTIKQPEVIVISDDGGTDRRAHAVAYAVADVMRIPRNTICEIGIDDIADKDSFEGGKKHEAKAANTHVYEMTKIGRYMVV